MAHIAVSHLAYAHPGGELVAGMRLGTAIADFSALGGYELEG